MRELDKLSERIVADVIKTLRTYPGFGMLDEGSIDDDVVPELRCVVSNILEEEAMSRDR